MRSQIRLAILGLVGVLWLAGVRGNGEIAANPAKEAACGDYGTSVHFEKSPSAAARKAIKEEKLVMVLHVSGDFENPEFT